MITYSVNEIVDKFSMNYFCLSMALSMIYNNEMFEKGVF